MTQSIIKTVKVEMRYQLPEQSGLVQNVYYVKVDTISEAVLDELQVAFQTWENEIASLQRSVDCALTEIVCTGMESLDDPRKVYPVVPPIAGQLDSGALPANVTVALHASVGNRGRGISGRKFWIGLANVQVTGSVIEAASMTAILAALNDLRLALTGEAEIICLAVPHLVVGGVRPAVCTSSCILSFGATDSNTDSQKLRLPNHKKRKLHPVG